MPRMPTTPTPSTTIYPHPTPLTTLAPHLSPHLPHTLCLLRRLQFHAQSPDAHVFATFPPGSEPGENVLWAAAFVDRSRAPETECWLFSSVEILAAPLRDFQLHSPGTTSRDEGPDSAADRHADAEVDWHPSHLQPVTADTARRQVLSLLARIQALGVPDEFAHLAPDQPAHVLLVGGLHEITLSLLMGVSTATLRNVELAEHGQHGRRPEVWQKLDASRLVPWCTEPWLKFLFEVAVSPSASVAAATAVVQQSIGDGDEDNDTEAEDEEKLIASLDLEWTTVREGEYALVRSRTTIPRRDRTLMLLPSIGLRMKRTGDGGDDGTLVAWAFLGVDGGLTSLHVEPEYRGKGVGKAVSKRVLTLLAKGLVHGKGFIGLESEVATGRVWSYSHTAIDNVGSIGVAKGLGGRQACVEYWVLVDLNAISVD